MYDFLDKIGLKAVLEAVKGKMPASLPANGGNADTLDGRHCGRIATLDSNGNYWSSKAEDINDAYLQWDGSNYFRLKTYGKNLTHVDNSDTVDGLHADDFVKSLRQQFDLPSNVDVPTWIFQNAKLYTIYRTYSGIAGLTNVPNNSGEYVWYWYDGVNILAREYATGRYYICDTINGGFSGWKDVYTSGFKPYVAGEVTGASGSAIITTNHGFTPSAVFWWMISQGRVLHSAHSFDTTSFTLSSSLTSDALVNYIIFR